MAYTQDDIDALKAAIKSGKLSVRHGETQVTYRSIDEMIKLLQMMTADVTTRTRSTVASYRSFR